MGNADLTNASSAIVMTVSVFGFTKIVKEGNSFYGLKDRRLAEGDQILSEGWKLMTDTDSIANTVRSGLCQIHTNLEKKRMDHADNLAWYHWREAGRYREQAINFKIRAERASSSTFKQKWESEPAEEASLSAGGISSSSCQIESLCLATEVDITSNRSQEDEVEPIASPTPTQSTFQIIPLFPINGCSSECSYLPTTRERNTPMEEHEMICPPTR